MNVNIKEDQAAHVAGMISVIIPAYNAARFLPRAVQSVQAQVGLSVPLEIVIVNDGSSDATVQVAQDLAGADARIVFVNLEINQGPAAARNAGVARASGEWIAVLDADDAYTTGRLARLMDLACAENLDAVADLPLLYDLEADCAAPQEMQHPASGDLVTLAFRNFLEHDATTGLDLGLLKPMYHASLKTRGLLQYPANLRHGEDCALYVAMTRAGVRFGFLHEAHYIFSTRIGAVSGARSPGSVTLVDYRAIAAETDRLEAALEAQGELDAELRAVLAARRGQSLRQNRIYGWSCLRRREWKMLMQWLRKHPGNVMALAKIFAAKLAGHRGLPE